MKFGSLSDYGGHRVLLTTRSGKTYECKFVGMTGGGMATIEDVTLIGGGSNGFEKKLPAGSIANPSENIVEIFALDSNSE